MWIVDPKIPVTLWWAMAIVAAATLLWYSLRREWPVPKRIRMVLVALLALGLIGPLIIALNPMWVEAVPPLPGKPMLTVLVDGTASMRTKDGSPSDSQSRWDVALELAKQIDAEDVDLDIRYQSFSDWLQPLEINAADANTKDDSANGPTGHRSNLASALRQTTRNGSPLGHAILLVSDGAHNVGSTESVFHAATESRALSTPVYTVTLGTSVGTKNMSLTARSPRMIAFPNNPVTIRVNLNHTGLAGANTQVSLIRNEQVIETQGVRLDNNTSREVRFNLPDGVSEGMERFVISATEVPGEATSSDNRTTVLVQKLNAPIGVLVLEGKPYWDSKFLARNLANDPVVSLTSVVRVGPDRFLKRQLQRESLEDTSVVETGDDWNIEKGLASPLESKQLLEQYRLVILGRDADAYLTDAGIENLRQWMSHQGGCLLCARGAPTDKMATKLAELLPVRWTASDESRYRASVSQHGVDTSVFDPIMSDGEDPLGSLPSLSVGAIPKPRAGLPQVLMQSTSLPGTEETVMSAGIVPLVTYQPIGSGQSIVVEGAGMWRWAFLPPQHAAKDKIYPTLWQSLVQWIIAQQDMMPGQDISVRPDRATFLSGDRASATVLMREPNRWNDQQGRNDLSVLVQGSEEDLPQRFGMVSGGNDNAMLRVDLGVLDVGYYTLKVVSGERDEVLAVSAFEVRDPWFESLEVDARPDIMSQIARLSSGEVLAQEEVGSLPKRFQERLRAQNPSREIRTTLWDRPFVLVLILISWIGTWMVRRLSGLV